MHKSKVVLTVVAGLVLLTLLVPPPDLSGISLQVAALHLPQPAVVSLTVIVGCLALYAVARLQPWKALHLFWLILTRPVEPPLIKTSSAQLANQLHDTALQTLVVAGHLARKHPDSDPGLAEHLEAAYHQMENVILRARVPELVEEGLGPICGQLADTFERRDNLKIIWHWELPPAYQLSHPASSLIYRTLLETALHLTEHTSSGHFTATVRNEGDNLTFRLVSAALAPGELPTPRPSLEALSAHAESLGWTVKIYVKGLHLVVEGELPRTWLYPSVVPAGSPVESTLGNPSPTQLPAAAVNH